MEHWFKQTGWIGMVLIGGVNSVGAIEAHG